MTRWMVVGGVSIHVKRVRVSFCLVSLERCLPLVSSECSGRDPGDATRFGIGRLGCHSEFLGALGEVVIANNRFEQTAQPGRA